MGRAGHASCACGMPGANAIPNNNASPARCFIAFSFCFSNRRKQVLCRLLEFQEFQVVSCCAYGFMPYRVSYLMRRSLSVHQAVACLLLAQKRTEPALRVGKIWE